MAINTRKEQIEKLLSSDPNDLFLLFALAKEYEKENNWQLAISSYEKLFAIDPSYIAYYYHYGKLQERLSKKEEAIKVFKAGIIKCMESNDLHSKSELQSALMNLEMEDLI